MQPFSINLSGLNNQGSSQYLTDEDEYIAVGGKQGVALQPYSFTLFPLYNISTAVLYNH